MLTTPRRQAVIGMAGAAVSVAGLVLLLRPHAAEMSEALRRVSPGWFVCLTALAIGPLFLRIEAWWRCLRRVDNQLRTRELHSASAAMFLVSLANPLLASGVRIALLRRLAPGRAPAIGQMAAAEAPVVLAEAAFVALLLAVSTAGLGLPVWVPLAAVAAVLGAGWILVYAERTWKHLAWFEGLAVLSDRREASKMFALIAGIFALHIARTWLCLHIVGVDATLTDAVLLFVATGVLGLLPLGPTGPTAAAVLVVGHSGVAAAAAAGLVLTSTAVAAACVYAVGAAAVHLRELRARPRRGRHTKARA